MSTTRAESSVDVRPAEVWRSARGPVAVGLAVVVLALVITIAGSGTSTADLDPRSAAPGGSRALATLLRDQGVQVDVVTRAADALASATAGSTVLIVVPDLLDDEQAAAFRDSAADLVLLEPTGPERFAPAIEAVRPVEPGKRAADCVLPAAARAGDVDAGGINYRARQDPETDVDLCYSRGGRPSIVQVRKDGRAVTVFGSAEPLTNDRLDDRGNAALAMGVLGARPRLVWYIPSFADSGTSGQQSLYRLIPAGVWWAVFQVAIAVVLLAFWRGRRLGPVVPEPLPVVVRAAEVVEGRGRLYRRARARDRAADELRAGLLARVGPGLGLPRRAGGAETVDAVATRSGRPAADVAALLYGAPPLTDDALVRLADELDRLEREVRRP